MSVAHCLPSSSTGPAVRCTVLVVIVIVAASCRDVAAALEVAASAVAVLGYWAQGSHVPALR
jgi:hypothetical protein